MKKQKLTAITVAAVTALTPISGSSTVYAKLIPSDTDIIVSDEEENTYTGEDVDVDEAMKDSIDKTTAINNAVSMTDKIAKVNKDKNVMFSPASLNFALGMLAEGADGETKKVLQKYLGTENFAEYAKWYMDKIKYYNSEEENYGYKSKLKIADAVPRSFVGNQAATIRAFAGKDGASEKPSIKRMMNIEIPAQASGNISTKPCRKVNSDQKNRL